MGKGKGKKKGAPPPSASGGGWRINWLQAVAAAVIGLLLGTPLGMAIRSHERQQDAIARQKAERQMALRALRALRLELGKNSEAMQLKGGLCFGITQKPPTDETGFAYSLAMLRVPQFSQMAPALWGQEFKVLLMFGQPGQDAFEAVGLAYERIKTVENDEASIMILLEKEKDATQRLRLLYQLQQSYDSLREPLIAENNMLSRLPNQEPLNP